MGKIILITGGVRSGKSRLAEQLAGNYGDKVLYIATMVSPERIAPEGAAQADAVQAGAAPGSIAPSRIATAGSAPGSIAPAGTAPAGTATAGTATASAVQINPDFEMQQRIAAHVGRRPLSWNTLEKYKNFDEALIMQMEGKDAAILDCLTMMVSNLMYDCGFDESSEEALNEFELNEIEKAIKAEVEQMLNIASRMDFPLHIVTNEVGMGVVPASRAGRLFRDVAGKMNQIAAAKADEVYLCVSGIPIRIK